MSLKRSYAQSDSTPFVPAFFALCGTTVLCVALLVVRGYQTEVFRHGFLLWNLFLAWLPLIASMTAVLIGSNKVLSEKVKIPSLVAIGIAWMLFYPNAPYLVTDLIHVFIEHSLGWDSRSLILWFDLITYFLFSWCGLMLGYLSMYQFHELVKSYLGAAAGWLFILVVSVLGGFGVYLGRVIRLNSWDVLFSPFRLIEGVKDGLNYRGFIFTILFALLILIVYLSIISLRYVSSGRTGKREDPARTLNP
ncbi:DUF1361 domain-containing protein [Cohnella thailandensis]|uniref:DUF1361 domain-containing protein n=1 Tax=Cohnella thailandensis TaxID=557557 RepID=A0A841SXD5_9BACL|nr:DUF1361 domain-containing protein [Cohnella thailandensis]MBB6635579.1 DUF1361 domain-containing protein [Cohnella thailandensis]MBP1974959.1 putative membrane protein [Cohnella thailandensis]